MNHRKLLLMVVVVSLVALAGCGAASDTASENQGEELANSTGSDISGEVGESAMFEMRMTESNHYGLVQAQPPVKMDESLERANLIERYDYLNDRSNLHHVYMLANDGSVIKYEVAQGKVSSVNSKLTNDKQIVEIPGAEFDDHTGGDAGAEGPNFKVIDSPQMDGSYGTNGDAIFFFTPDGQYVEYNGIYVVSEEPQQINTAVTLVDNADEDTDGNSTSD
jgi:hypothetical protein